MAVHVYIHLVPRYEKLLTGLWCPHCLKPSGYRLTCDRISDDGVTPDFLVLRKCYDCEAPLSAVNEAT